MPTNEPMKLWSWRRW